MEIIFVDKEIQNEESTEIQLINGETHHWKTKLIKLYGTFQEYLNTYLRRDDIKYFLIHDIKSGEKGFCDQGCKVGEGCKKYYSENNHVVWLNCAIIKK